MMRSKQALASYQQNKVIAAGTLDNHKMILMLMEGALQKINEAKAGMIKNQIAKKGEAVSAARTALGSPDFPVVVDYDMTTKKPPREL